MKTDIYSQEEDAYDQWRDEQFELAEIKKEFEDRAKWANTEVKKSIDDWEILK